MKLCMLKGLYRDMVNMTAQHSKAKRGYLIDADDQPLTDPQVGKLLNIKGPMMRKIMGQYAEVKLLEKVELPAFLRPISRLSPSLTHVKIIKKYSKTHAFCESLIHRRGKIEPESQKAGD